MIKPERLTTDEHTPCILWARPDGQSESDCACSDADVRPLVLCSPAVGKAESDCACPSVNLSPTPARGATAALWQTAPHLYRRPLPRAHELAFNPNDPLRLAVLNEPASRVLDSFTLPRPLAKAADRELAALGLLTPACSVEHTTYNTPDTLTAWLHITAACNLRCAYCYLHGTGEAMSEEAGRSAVEAVFRSAAANGFRAVKLKYAGGEPALRWPLVRALHSHAQTLAAQSRLDLRAVALSNGTALTDEMLLWLRDEGVRLMISLDGVGAAHDAQRPFADGRGSSVQVARNIDRALALGLSPHLSITVTARNADRLADVVTFALERDLLFNLNFVREPGYTPAHRASLIAGIKAALVVIEAALPPRRLIDGLLDRSAFGAPHEHPCGAGRSYLVIDPRGRVARCQMTMDEPVTDVWADDPLRAVREWRGGFQNVPVDEREGCRNCTWRYWCAGGCPLLAYRTTGRSDVPSPYCAVYKALYPEVLRLEGLRLLKWRLPAD